MADSFAQLNALLSAAAAQQQKQNQSQNQNNQPATSSSSGLPMNMQNMSGLNEQSLQSLLYAQLLQKNNNQTQRHQSAFDQRHNFDVLSSDNDSFRNDNHSYNQHNNPHYSMNSHQHQSNSNQRYHQQQNEPQIRVLEPYFSDDNTLSSSSQNFNNTPIQKESSYQNDMFNEFQKVSLNESNQKMNSSIQNSSINNTSSNFDASMFSLNDSEINSVDQNYLPGTASLIEDVDKQIMVALRDGRTLIGYLRSIDQYANLLLSSTFERVHVGNKYGDIPKGIYLIRGENVVLIGEVDLTMPVKVEMIKLEVNEILELKRAEEKTQENEKNQKKMLLKRCLIPNNDVVLDEYY